ncbi:MAG: hypothetical protein KDB10_08290 [Acidimicrobiales bacterium]|nr:hypothetical protein [Acidimicrobiales bacterium]MCB9371330.1 hypothetical protein [Microthrixaceae bacterium]
MSSLWTPGGEVPVDRRASSAPAGGGGADEAVDALEAMLASLPEEQRAEFQQALAELSPEERQQYLERLVEMADTQQRVVESPVEVMVGNHAVGLFELAALHLQQQPPNLPEAKVAIDAMTGMLGAVAGRLGEHEADLKTMLSQIQLAFVQVNGGGEPATDGPDGPAGDDA